MTVGAISALVAGPQAASTMLTITRKTKNLKLVFIFYQNGVLISERTYGPRGERRPQKKATLTYKVAFSFHNIYTLLEIASP